MGRARGTLFGGKVIVDFLLRPLLSLPIMGLGELSGQLADVSVETGRDDQQLVAQARIDFERRI